VPEINISQHIQQLLLMEKVPYTFSTITADACHINQFKADGTFFEILHPAPQVVDIMVGRPQIALPHALTLAAAIKYDLIHFAKPISRGYQFDKIRLWEKNLFTPQEIVKRVHSHFAELLEGLETSLCLFYGRFQLQYRTLTYLNFGLDKALYLNHLNKQAFVLQETEPALGGEVYEDYPIRQMNINLGDGLIFYSDRFNQDRNILEKMAHALNEEKVLTELIEQEAFSITKYIKKRFNDWVKENKPLEGICLVVKLAQKDPQTPRQPFVVKFASDLSQLHAVRLFTKQICQQAPGDFERLEIQVQLAVNEIFCNIVQHSYHQNKGEILIEGQLVQDGLYMTLSDHGDSFNPLETKHPNLVGDQKDGFGIFIVQQIADHLAYTPKTDDDQWNHFRIFKRYFSREEYMEFSHHIQDNILIITPLGENLDAKNAASFKEGVLALTTSTKLSKLIFDLNHLQFIDSSGLGTFLSIQRTLNTHGGTLKLSNLNKPIRTMFEIVSMHRIFDIFPTNEEAIQSF